MTAFDYVVNNLNLIQKATESDQEFFNRVVVSISTLSEQAWEALPEELQLWYNEVAESITGEGDVLAPIPGHERPTPKSATTKLKVASPKPKGTAKPKAKPQEVEEQKEDQDELMEELVEVVEEQQAELAALEDVVEELAEVQEELAEEELEGMEEVEEKPVTKPKPKAPKEPKPKAPKEPKPQKAPKERDTPIAAEVVRELLCEDCSRSIDDILALLEQRGVEMKRSSVQVVHLNTVRAFQKVLEVGQVSDKGVVVIVKS